MCTRQGDCGLIPDGNRGNGGRIAKLLPCVIKNVAFAIERHQTELMLMSKHEVHNIVDLFSGAGGLSLGSARAGFMVRGAVDNDPKANDTHMRNFPKATHLDVDIAKLTGDALMRTLFPNGESITGIVGGPPCQGFSVMGRRDRDDARNMLFVDFFRIVSEIRPKFFLVENVPGIMQGKYDEIRERAFSLVNDRYEILPAMHLFANQYGAATNRKRVFFFGYLSDEMGPFTVENFDSPSGRQARVRQGCSLWIAYKN